MTESIFAPFVMTTKESVEKFAEVLLGEPSPRIKGDSECKVLSPEEARAFFAKRRAKDEQETK